MNPTQQARVAHEWRKASLLVLFLSFKDYIKLRWKAKVAAVSIVIPIPASATFCPSDFICAILLLNSAHSQSAIPSREEEAEGGKEQVRVELVASSRQEGAED